jgi:hypothetical protein
VDWEQRFCTYESLLLSTVKSSVENVGIFAGACGVSLATPSLSSKLAPPLPPSPLAFSSTIVDDDTAKVWFSSQ